MLPARRLTYKKIRSPLSLLSPLSAWSFVFSGGGGEGDFAIFVAPSVVKDVLAYAGLALRFSLYGVTTTTLTFCVLFVDQKQNKEPPSNVYVLPRFPRCVWR